MPDRKKMFWNNLEKRIFEGVGEYRFPELKPEKYYPCEYIRFIEAEKCKDRKGVGVHFFMDDYHFDKIWNMLGRYSKMLSQFDAVLTPQWSLYTDWPKAVNIWDHYKSHYVGAYLQEMGVRVYPSIAWADKESYDWCFEGEPVGGCVAVGSIGMMKDIEAKKLFVYGYDAMLERLQPETIMFWGVLPKECRGNIIRMDQGQGRFRREVGEKHLNDRNKSTVL